MQKDADTFISNNDSDFIIKALIDECRLDGRKPYDFRKINFKFSLDGSTATVALGSTRVMTVVTASLEAPFPGRPMEGTARFNVELSPMASPAFDPYGGGLGGGSRRQTELSNELVRLVERIVKQSGALDLESLCVVSGRNVWALRIDTHVLNHDGNLIDACVLSAVAALKSFRRPDVEVRAGGAGGDSSSSSAADEIIVHSPEVREPHPLTMHHLPMSVTFALYEDGNLVAVDPTLRETAAAAGSCTIAMSATAHDLCGVQKVEGVGLTVSQFGRCLRLAAAKADAVADSLNEALSQYEVARIQARVRRHRKLTPGEFHIYKELEQRKLAKEAADADADGAGVDADEKKRQWAGLNGADEAMADMAGEEGGSTDEEMGTEEEEEPADDAKEEEEEGRKSSIKDAKSRKNGKAAGGQEGRREKISSAKKLS